MTQVKVAKGNVVETKADAIIVNLFRLKASTSADDVDALLGLADSAAQRHAAGVSGRGTGGQADSDSRRPGADGTVQPHHFAVGMGAGRRLEADREIRCQDTA